ncbi:hypothetical protein [Aeromicrobium wangtongii]|uniref:Lipocalin-like domain-containing protein n=1 Tax=Aeromicrobium wangtongii TaxID=2969247 RepID=A0ABY5M7M5_9ACTN|nr:hypothetical protein [Aeromicrobium wangtongii]MCD9199195.1 hypothetical protein [Aeromicrobium wangtongii]UUP12777.1 hypothetical protein NQV15_13050 [Aeromicrobium wangtongii]
MHRRVTLATAIGGAILTVLAGCGSDGSAGESTPAPTTPSETASATPSVDPSSPDATTLSGDWQIPAEDYVLHLADDGTFVEDFQGVVDFRTGKYQVDGDTISLVGDDGNTDKGTIEGETLKFTLGTATRVE